MVTAEPLEVASTHISVVHRTNDGRIRIHVLGLYRSETLAAELETTLRHTPDIKQFTINILTGNVLLEFVNGAQAPSVLGELGRLASRRADRQVRANKAERKKPEKSKEGASRWSWLGRQMATGSGRSEPSAPIQQDSGQRWHTLDAERAMQQLESSQDGLASDEAYRRLQTYGPNRLAEHKRRSALQMLAEQVANPAMALLGISAVVSVATGGIVDAVVIVSAVALNALVGYLTENSSERTIDALGAMTPTRARILRGGHAIDVAVEDLVVGDMLLLTPGSYVAADARLISSSRLTVDEAALTGESLPVGKTWDFIAAEETPLGDRKNMLHMGTVVTGGSGRALVTATGRNTEIGVIQSLVGEVRPPDTLLQRQLDDMSTQLATVCGALCVGVFGLGMLRGYTWLQMLSSSISLAVAAIPEGLPAVATTTLAIGIRNMQRERVLIRQLPAVESLGSVEVICMDKTGTLTLNQMKTVTMRTASFAIDVRDDRFLADEGTLTPLEHEEPRRLLEVVSLCSEVKLNGEHAGPELEGSPTESALIRAALDAGVDVCALRAAHPLLKMSHRAEDRPYMVTVHDCGDGRLLFAVKGSPSEVLRLCEWRQRGDRAEELDKSGRSRIKEENNRLAGDALRVLGVAYAYREGTSDTSLPPLIWLGLIAMEDAIRPDVDRLVVQFHEAGVRTVMITGDQSATAASVARRLRLSGDGPLEIIDSTNLDKLDPDILKGIVDDTAVFARVSPAHKLRIVQALQEAGHVVAMTGDGVNDGPALRAADIGVAMGSNGTDVARSVADVVLEDDNLQTMVAAIRQGRTIYANIRKSLRFLLATNLSEIELALLTMALGLGEALNPLQLLWINMVGDIAPALALALEPPELDVLKQAPRDPQQPIINGQDFRKLLRESLLITAGSMGVYGLSIRRYGMGMQAGTNTFMAFTLAKFLHALSCRSEETTVLDRQRPANPHMLTALGGTLLLQVLAVSIPPLRSLLRSSPLLLADLPLIAAGASLPFLVNESAKQIQLKRPKGVLPL